MSEGVTPDAMARGRRRARAGVLEPGIALPAAAHRLVRLIEQAQLELLLSGRLETCGGPVRGRGTGQQAVKRLEENGVAAG